MVTENIFLPHNPIYLLQDQVHQQWDKMSLHFLLYIPPAQIQDTQAVNHTKIKSVFNVHSLRSKKDTC